MPVRAASRTSASRTGPFSTPLRCEGASLAIACTSSGASVPVAGCTRIAWTARIDRASSRAVLISMASSSCLRSSGPGAAWRSTWLLSGSRRARTRVHARLPAVAWSARICAIARGTGGGALAGSGREGDACSRIVFSMWRRYARSAEARNQGTTLRLGLELALSELDPADLSGERLGQVIHELDLARVRVRAQARAHVRLDVVDQIVARRVPLGEHDERLDHVPAPLVGRRDGRRLLDRRVLEAGGLDLERA